MRDIAITIEQAAHWLNCSTAKIKEYLASGLLRNFEGRSGDAAKVISLNATVILAESLPVEAGIFQIAEKRDYELGAAYPDAQHRPRAPVAGSGPQRPDRRAPPAASLRRPLKF